MSEIVFEAKNKKEYSAKLDLIKNEIKINGFKNTALKYSVSDSKHNGGSLGWINAASISKNLNNKIKKLETGEYIEPEVIPGGFLILKLNEIKLEEISLNPEKELEKMIILKTNQQLNRFSNIYLNKVKKDIKIEKI